MQVICRRCAGLDLHEKSVSVCVQMVRGKQVESPESTFPAFTEELGQLKTWLVRRRIRPVAMESAGVYWQPIWNILERSPDGLELVLLNR